MGDVSKNTPLAIALRELRQDNYRDAKAVVSDAIGLEKYLTIFELKAFLIKSTKDKWGETKESDMVLMALGLLDGYYYDTKHLGEVNPSYVAIIGNRREKYLQLGPYIRTKGGKCYASYDSITDEEKRAVKNSLGQQDGRLLNELADYILKINDIEQYIKVAKVDAQYTIKATTKSGRIKRLLRLPKQCSFLEDFPPPSEHSVSEEISETKVPRSTLPSVEELFPTDKEIILIPGQIFELKVAILPKESIDAPLNFVSLDPSIVTVSTRGMLKAEKKPQKLLHNIKKSQFLGDILDNAKNKDTDFQTVEIVIQAESGITASKLVAVDYSKGGYEPPVEDINDFVPGFTVMQKIRLSGTTEWFTGVNAEIGDKVDIQIQYKNIDEIAQANVMIRDVLPPNLAYVPGTTKLYNSNHDGGAKVNQDTIATTGINIGSYASGSNAFVRFSAKVVDVNLVPGSNMLVNWSQAGVGQITLNDYVTAVVLK